MLDNASLDVQSRSVPVFPRSAAALSLIDIAKNPDRARKAPIVGAPGGPESPNLSPGPDPQPLRRVEPPRHVLLRELQHEKDL